MLGIYRSRVQSHMCLKLMSRDIRVLQCLVQRWVMSANRALKSVSAVLVVWLYMVAAAQGVLHLVLNYE
jgi:hypothetical protein